jgi:hypothetical protein
VLKFAGGDNIVIEGGNLELKNDWACTTFG